MLADHRPSQPFIRCTQCWTAHPTPGSAKWATPQCLLLQLNDTPTTTTFTVMCEHRQYHTCTLSATASCQVVGPGLVTSPGRPTAEHGMQRVILYVCLRCVCGSGGGGWCAAPQVVGLSVVSRHRRPSLHTRKPYISSCWQQHTPQESIQMMLRRMHLRSSHSVPSQGAEWPHCRMCVVCYPIYQVPATPPANRLKSTSVIINTTT